MTDIQPGVLSSLLVCGICNLMIWAPNSPIPCATSQSQFYSGASAAYTFYTHRISNYFDYGQKTQK